MFSLGDSPKPPWQRKRGALPALTPVPTALGNTNGSITSESGCERLRYDRKIGVVKMWGSNLPTPARSSGAGVDGVGTVCPSKEIPFSFDNRPGFRYDAGMKTLAQEFTQATDGLAKHSFKQLKRNDKVVIYELRKLDGTLFGYEVFIVKSHTFPKQDGSRTEPAETYPRANAFGRTAYFCSTLDRANARFAELLAQQPN